jgi:peptide subunit release factor RF-3
MVEDAVQVWRNLLESQVVLLVAVGAVNQIEVLALRLLRSQ